MKKLFTLCFGLIIVSSSALAVTSCAWKTPPVGVDNILKIMNTYKDDLEESGKTTIAKNDLAWSNPVDLIFSIDKSKVDESVKTLLDSANNDVNKWLLDQINNQKSFVDSKDLSDKLSKNGITKEQSGLMIGTYFSVQTVDIMLNDGEKDKWITQLEGASINEIKFSNGNLKVDDKNKSNSPKILEKANYSVFNSSDLVKVQDIYKTKKNKLTIKDVEFLISVNPSTKDFKNLKPTAFYVDVITSK